MSEWKQWRCPGCDSAEYEKVSPTERKCRYCGAMSEREPARVPVVPFPILPMEPLRFDGDGYRLDYNPVRWYGSSGTSDPYPSSLVYMTYSTAANSSTPT